MLLLLYVIGDGGAAAVIRVFKFRPTAQVESFRLQLLPLDCPHSHLQFTHLVSKSDVSNVEFHGPLT